MDMNKMAIISLLVTAVGLMTGLFTTTELPHITLAQKNTTISVRQSNPQSTTSNARTNTTIKPTHKDAYLCIGAELLAGDLYVQTVMIRSTIRMLLQKRP